MQPARVVVLIVATALLVVPADRSRAEQARGPLFSKLVRIEATSGSRTETVVDRFTQLGQARSDETGTLAADDDVGLLAAELDVLGVDEAAFSTDVFRFRHDGAALLQYRAVATGTGVNANGRYMVIAFAQRNGAEAAEQLRRLDTVLRSGTNTAARRAWSELLSVERIETRGRVVVAVLPTTLDTLWLLLERTPDTLLWWSP